MPYESAEDDQPVSTIAELDVMEPRFSRSVSLDQAASLLSVSKRTVYNWIRDGRLETVRTLGGSQRVLVQSLFARGFQPQACATSAAAAMFDVLPITHN